MFSAEKATDMAIYLLQQQGGVDSQNYTKIMKMMYLAERESYHLYHEPMCGDDAFSLPFGPVLSKVGDFMRGTVHAKEWSDFIRKDGYDIALIDEQTKGHRKLSRADKKILSDIWQAHKSKTWQALCDWTHDNCAEWDSAVNDDQTPYRRSAISVQSLLKSVGVADKDMHHALKRVSDADDFAHLKAHWAG